MATDPTVQIPLLNLKIRQSAQSEDHNLSGRSLGSVAWTEPLGLKHVQCAVENVGRNHTARGSDEKPARRIQP